MKKFIIRFWPLLFLFALFMVFSYPYFLQNKVPYSSTYQVNHFFPWSAYPKYWGPVKNGAMPDVTSQIYPWRHLTIETWKNGDIPFWNPNNFSGNPHLANYQSAVFSPLNLLFFTLPFADAWSMLILLQPFFAGFFTYLLLREFKISKEGSLAGSISFMFCGFIVVWMAYGTLSWAIAVLPLAIYSIQRWFEKKDKFPLFILALSIPFSFFSGHFQTSLYFLGFTTLFLIYKSFTNREKVTPIVSAFLIGLLISLVQIIPSVQFYLESSRSEIFTPQTGIPLYYLINLFAPDFFGNPVTRNDWFGYYAEWASFVGIIPLVLVIFAIFKRNKLLNFLLILGIGILILTVDSPVQKFITDLRIPVISTSNPTRIIVLFSFILSVLNGFGFDSLKKLILDEKFKAVKSTILKVGALFVLTWITILFLNPMPEDREVIAQRNFILPTIIFIGFAFLIFISTKLKGSLKSIAIFAILFLIAFDSLRFAQKWMPFDPKELVFPDTPVVKGIAENIGFGRMYGNFGGEMASYYGIPSIEGYDPLYIERYGEFITSAASGEFTEAQRSVVLLDRRGEFTDRVLDLLGVSLFFHPVADTNQGWAYPVWEDKSRFVSVFHDGNFELFKNHTALERARIFYNYEVITDKKGIIERFYSDDFDFRNKLILEEDPKLPKLPERPQGNARIISYGPNKVIIEATSKENGLLFLSDNYYPKWKAKVNGKNVKIYRADYTFRAVIIPKGTSNIEFYYESFGF